MRRLTLLAATALTCATSAHATIIFDPSRVAESRQVVAFGDMGFLSGGLSFSFLAGVGTVNSGGASFSSADAFTFGSTGPTDLGINGHWGQGASYLAFDASGPMTLTIAFGGKTTRSFGADWSLYEADGDTRNLTVRAFDRHGLLLESFTTARDGVDLDDNELTDSWNSSFFQGIRRRTADIATITVSGERIVMDNFAFTLPVAAIPEPEGYAMFLAGLGIMGAVARRRSGR